MCVFIMGIPCRHDDILIWNQTPFFFLPHLTFPLFLSSLRTFRVLSPSQVHKSFVPVCFEENTVWWRVVPSMAWSLQLLFSLSWGKTGLLFFMSPCDQISIEAITSYSAIHIAWLRLYLYIHLYFLLIKIKQTIACSESATNAYDITALG